MTNLEDVDDPANDKAIYKHVADLVDKTRDNEIKVRLFKQDTSTLTGTVNLQKTIEPMKADTRSTLQISEVISLSADQI